MGMASFYLNHLQKCYAPFANSITRVILGIFKVPIEWDNSVPKLEVPTMSKATLRAMFGNIATKYCQK